MPLYMYIVIACIDCHCLGIYTVILLSLLPFSAKMTVSSRATQVLSAQIEDIVAAMERAVGTGLGRIVALPHRASTAYQIH